MSLAHLNIKIREVFIPFLLVAVGIFLSYGIFRWLFDVKLGVIPLKEDVLNLWIPAGLTFIAILIFLRKRIRILKVGGKGDNGYFLYQFAMVFAIGIPLFLSQDYLLKSMYDLKEVSSVSEIATLTNEKYFKVRAFTVDQEASVPYVTSRVSGRHNTDLDFELYLACPFKFTENIWYGVQYSKRTSNRGTKERKNIAYKTFINVSQRRFEKYNFRDIRYFEKLGYSDDSDGFLNAIKDNYPEKVREDQIILIPKENAFEDRFRTSFSWILGSFAIGFGVIFLMVIFPKIDQKEYKRIQNKQPLKEDDLREILQFLNPRGAFKGTAILILANLIVFVMMIFAGLNILSPTPQELLEIGGNRRPEVLQGEYWRLFTAVFIHGGLAHLFFNLIGIALGGIFLEKIVGSVRLVVMYLICGLLASVASICWHEDTVSVGASGAIFGLYGILLALLVFKIIPKYDRGFVWKLLGLLGGISLLFGFLSSGTDNAGHVGGLFSGFLVGMLLSVLYGKQLKKS